MQCILDNTLLNCDDGPLYQLFCDKRSAKEKLDAFLPRKAKPQFNRVLCHKIFCLEIRDICAVPDHADGDVGWLKPL